MHENKWTTDIEGFVKAAEADKYAELPLETGDVLITDWEMDGTFFPYVEPKHGHGKHDVDDIKDEIAMAIESKLDIEVTTLEWSEANGVYYPVVNGIPHLD
jgi:hypothetical protein